MRSFKGRKRELRISIIMLALIYTCGIMTILFLESFYRSRESLRYDTYGEWTGAVFGAEEGAGQILEESEATKRIGKIVVLGTSWQNGERLGEAGYVDRTAAAGFKSPWMRREIIFPCGSCGGLVRRMRYNCLIMSWRQIGEPLTGNVLYRGRNVC